MEDDRFGGCPQVRVLARVGERSFKMAVEAAGDGGYRVSLDGESMLVDARRVGGGAIMSLIIQGRSYETHVGGRNGDYRVALFGSAFQVELQDELASRVKSKGPGAAADRSQPILAPMPGLVVEMKVSTGDRVAAGQAIVVVEAMKMQNELSAAAPGVVSEVHVKKGDAVASGQLLVTLAAD
jgi:biotin carboxyl carrier protein